MALYTPNVFGFHPAWMTLASDQTHVTFEVKACGDAHVYLAEYSGITMSDAYEVVIGGWDNTQ